MKHTVVCIDDEEHNNQALERLLRKHYTVHTATNPEVGLQLITKLKPTLIISDQRMPEMTGVELLKKSVDASPESIRILLTGYTDLESVIAAINEGQIYRYLTKPWEPTDLLTTVEQAIESFELKQKVRQQNEELKSLDKLKTDFMLLISHELRTPLTGMGSFLELLNEEVSNDEHKMYCKHIQKNMDRMNELVENVLLITKFQTSNTNYEDTNIALTPIVSEIWRKIENKKNLECAVDGSDLQVNTSISILKKIIHKIIENCHKHSKEKSTVKIHTQAEDDHWILSVSNESNSELPEDGLSLAKSFHKNENIMNHTQGTGLGLSVVKSLVEHLRGTLQIQTTNQIFQISIRFPNK